MIFELIKAIAPAVLSSIANVDNWDNPVKQENPFVSITGLALKNIGEYLLEEESSNTNIDIKRDDDTSNRYDKYKYKSYRMNFK